MLENEDVDSLIDLLNDAIFKKTAKTSGSHPNKPTNHDTLSRTSHSTISKKSPITNENMQTSNLLSSSKPYFPMFVNRDPNSWGGNPKDLPIENFLFRVESLAENVFHISKDQLVYEFSALLRNDAQEWYWGYMRRRSKRRKN